MAKKAVLFDLDGTITDSGEGIINCAALALEHFGLPVPSREEMRVFVGPPLHETFVKFGIPEDKVEDAVAVFRSRYVPIGIFENHPYDGIHELLESLRTKGHKLYIATSKPEPMAIRVLEHFDLAKYFTLICGATLSSDRITKEDVIAYLLKESGEKDNMIMVGDTRFDVIGAKHHGIPCIGVSWGYGKVEEMFSAGAISIVNTTAELLALIEE